MADHAKALAQYEQAHQARAQALVAARAAGHSIRELGRELGVSHVRVLQLTREPDQSATVQSANVCPSTRRDERSAPEPEPVKRGVEDLVARLEATMAPSEHLPFDAPVSQPDPSATVCARLGCAEPAGEGRFCPDHARY